MSLSQDYDLDQTAQAHADMEAGAATGKLAVTTSRSIQ